MSDTNKKTPLEEAKLGYDEIKRFAEEQATIKLQEQMAEKLKNIFEEKLNEDITININGEDVEVEKDGEVIGTTLDTHTAGAEEMGLDVDNETTMGHDDSSESEFEISDDEDEIALDEIMDEIQNKNMEEMNNMQMEQDVAAAPAAPVVDTTAAPAAPAAPIDGATETPIEDAPAMPELLSKLDTLINIMLQQNGGAAPEDDGATAGTEQDFEVIDDEAGAAAPVAQAPAAPIQEEEIEIVDFVGNEDKSFIDEMEEQMLEIVDEDEVSEGPTVEETRSLGFTSKRTGDKALKMGTMEKEKGHHAPVTSLKESNKNKAHNESKVDELIKENSSLKSAVKGLQKERKEFEEAFVELRTQFNEMQLFNGKLALVNKVLMNGGLTTEEKIKICEQFDRAQTYEEANKLFKNIIKENNIKVGSLNDTVKLKGASTNTIKPKSTSEPLYESTEARRAKILAGLIKPSEEN